MECMDYLMSLLFVNLKEKTNNISANFLFELGGKLGFQVKHRNNVLTISFFKNLSLVKKQTKLWQDVDLQMKALSVVAFKDYVGVERVIKVAQMTA